MKLAKLSFSGSWGIKLISENGKKQIRKKYEMFNLHLQKYGRYYAKSAENFEKGVFYSCNNWVVIYGHSNRHIHC